MSFRVCFGIDIQHFIKLPAIDRLLQIRIGFHFDPDLQDVAYSTFLRFGIDARDLKNLDPGCPIISGRRVSPMMASLCVNHLPEIDTSPNDPQNKSIE